MRLIFAGTPEAAVPSLEALLASRHEVAAVFTRADAPRGRGRRLEESPVSGFARGAGLPVLKPRTLRDPATQEEVAALHADAAAVVAYGLLVPPPLLALHPWVNLHFSLLPRWRGAAPVQRAILAGDEVTGACAFLLEEGLDTGPVLASLRRPIGPRETSEVVLGDLSHTGADLLVGVFDALEDGTAAPIPQGDDGVTLAPRLTTAEARVRWAAGPDAVDRQVRAFHPGAWSMLSTGQRVKVGPVEPTGTVLAVGEVTVAGDVLVGTGDGAVRLSSLAPAGKAWMEARDWARGLRGPVRFEDVP
ncbi:MAG: methionyl-tRNA formyltransferase [Actinomycetota bacterium]